MIDFMITYWFATVPTAVTGVLLLNMLKKVRDEKTKKRKVLAPIPVGRDQQN